MSAADSGMSSSPDVAHTQLKSFGALASSKASTRLHSPELFLAPGVSWAGQNTIRTKQHLCFYWPIGFTSFDRDCTALTQCITTTYLSAQNYLCDKLHLAVEEMFGIYCLLEEPLYILVCNVILKELFCVRFTTCLKVTISFYACTEIGRTNDFFQQLVSPANISKSYIQLFDVFFYNTPTIHCTELLVFLKAKLQKELKQK